MAFIAILSLPSSTPFKKRGTQILLLYGIFLYVCYDKVNMKSKEKLFPYLINLCFFLYFVILIVERVLSVSLSIANKVELFTEGFNAYTYSLVIVSLAGWLAYLLLRCRKAIVGLFKMDVEIPFIDLSIASGIILLSGMVHTEYTIPVIQFIAYGILIVGILLKVITLHKTSTNKLLLWLSFTYLVCFSMAIPVMYHSNIELATAFHVIEAISSFALVVIFTYLLVYLFKDNEDLFIIWPIVVALFLDTTIIILRWQEEINYFVLIFISLSVILFIVGYIISYKKKSPKGDQ